MSGESFDDPVESAGPQPRREPPVEVDPVMLARRVGELDGQVQRLHDAVVGTRGQVEDLTTAVEALMTTLEAEPGGPWHYGLITQGRRRELLLELGEWVRWLEDRYLVNLSPTEYPLPECWWRHPVAVELLTALMVAHQAVYTRSQAVASRALVEWHTYALVPVFALLKATNTFGRCEAEHAEPTRPPARHHPLAYVEWVDQIAPDVDDDSADETAPAEERSGE